MEDKNKYKVVRLNCKLFPVIPEELDELGKISISLIQLPGDKISPEFFDADVLMVVGAIVNKEVIKQLHRCRLIARIGIGTDKIDIDEATANGIIVSNVPDFCRSEMADHTMALLLAVARKIIQMDKATRICDWSIKDKINIKRIAGKNLGLIGFGRLAKAFAERAKAFELQIYAYDPYVESREMQKFGVIKVNLLEDILKDCEYVSLHLPLNSQTFHLIGEKQLRMMKSSAILINTARGAIIDEDALIEALSEGWISGAGIDVFEKLNPFEEIPTKQYSPLFLLENVVLTPHAGSNSDEALKEMKVRAAKEVVRVLSGKWPESCINPDVIPRFPLPSN